MYFDIYKSVESTHQKLLRILLLSRLLFTWAAIFFFTYAWYFELHALLVTALVLLSAAILLGSVEYHLFAQANITVADELAENNLNLFVVFFVAMSSLPLNFFLNIVGPRTSLEQNVYATFQIFLRVGFLFTVIILEVVYPDYKAAWSCYMTQPSKDYTKGYCPAYTKIYYDNFACRDSKPNNLACFGGELPSWKNPHIAVHISILLLTALYAQHVITATIAIIRFALKKQQ